MTLIAGFPESISGFLVSRGHVINCDNPGSYAAVQSVSRSEEGTVTAHSDSRKQGRASVVD